MKWISPLYPLHCLHELGSDFADCAAHTHGTKDALIGPVVLSAMSAAVHGVLDIYTPTHRVMPTSLYVSVIAGSGLGKSASVNCAYQGFRDFEAGCEGRVAGRDGFDPSQGHPYRLDDASESGVIALFGSGAKAIAMVLDEGGALAKHFDYPGMCKRYDGDDLRFQRKHEMILMRDTRTTFCMTIQDAVFDQLLKGKQGTLMVHSGLQPRMLLSYATDSVQHISFDQAPQNPNLHRFHDRVRELMNDYRTILQTSGQRAQISLSPEAEQLWHEADKYWKALPGSDEAWKGMEPFVQRAGEHAMRIAAVLQWFTDPGPVIELPYMQSALTLMEWHLEQALKGFGTPSEEAQRISLGDELYAYMLRKWKQCRQGTFSRVQLQRSGPEQSRKLPYLDWAIDQLLLEDKVVDHPPGSRKQLILNMTPGFVAQAIPVQPVPGRKLTDFLNGSKFGRPLTP